MARWTKGKLIGIGGFGHVYRAKSDEGGVCAWKELDSSKASPALHRRFAREVRIQSKLKHPNIMPIFHYDLERTSPLFLMPLAQGNLSQVLPSLRGDPTRALEAFKQVAAGIAHAHDNGVIHRDIKPQNVLAIAGRFVVSDFGLSRFIDRDSTTLTVTGNAMGTFIYSAPEQLIDGKSVDHRADIYSLGLLLYEITSGRSPGKDLDWTGIQSGVRYVVTRATRPNPDERYQSVDAMLRDVDLVMQSDRTSAFEDATEALRRLLGNALGQVGPPEVEELIRLLHVEAGNEALYTEIVPEIPDEFLEALAVDFEDDLLWLVRSYDECIQGTLPFSYCDVVADFYSRVFNATSNTEVRRLILARLLDIGRSHNRWHVQKTFCRLLELVREPDLALEVRDVLLADKAGVQHIEDRLRERPLVGILKESIRDICGR